MNFNKNGLLLTVSLLVVHVTALFSSHLPRERQGTHHESFQSLPTASFGAQLQQQPERLEGGRRWRYWCDDCACGFDKLKSQRQHEEGKRHRAVVQEADAIWEEYRRSGPVFFHDAVTRRVATRAWSLDSFLDGLPARSRSSVPRVLHPGTGGQLDPGLRLEDLTPDKRAMLWRLLHRSPGLPAMVTALEPKYVRIKEVLESLEVFRHVDQFWKKGTGQRVSTIYDIGCGHGLVGMLCAAAHPHIAVQSIDRVPRESFSAHKRAFQMAGIELDNLQFRRGDWTVLTDHPREDPGETSLVVCIHGCQALTHESIALARANGWAWLVLPCCLQAEHHLEASSLHVSDETRFALLCGAIAANYGAETIASIDSRITARGIVLASTGVQRQKRQEEIGRS